MSISVAQQTALLRSYILNRRFDADTLGIIESVMASKDVMEVRSGLREFFRSESMSIIHENAKKPLEKKLLDLEFLVRSFAVLGDIESCLALRYEALLLREFKSSSHQWLEVSHTEWLNFAEQSLDYGFHSIARKACENALLCFQTNSGTDAKAVQLFESLEVIEKIKRLRDCATTLAASHSVQAQAARFTESKLVEKSKACSSICERTPSVASSLFRNGIRKRNLRCLQESRCLQGTNDEPNSS